jgi:hypothetical protein
VALISSPTQDPDQAQGPITGCGGAIFICGASLEHMGIEFAVRGRLGRDNWALTILPKNRGPITNEFTGTRAEAIAAAHRRIARWLADNPTPLPKPPQR